MVLNTPWVARTICRGIFRNRLYYAVNSTAFNGQLRTVVQIHPVFVNQLVSHFSTIKSSINLESPAVKKHIENALKQYATENREKLYRLSEIVKKRDEVTQNIASLSELLNGKDSELKSLADEEFSAYQAELAELDNELLEELTPKNKHENYNQIMIEVTPGAGGQEAMIFAAELFRMYEKFALYMGWSFEIDSLNTSDLGGIRSAVAFIEGHEAYRYMQNEIGVHRVQRNPVTETGGRMHTSTAAVVVMPQPSEVDIVIHDNDLRWETMRGSGPGGQHVNKTESAVRLTHLPSGVITEASSSRKQNENRSNALKKLRVKLYAIEQEKKLSALQSTRRQQMGNRDRSEKIRTYNFQQDRISDHRLGTNFHHIKNVLEGKSEFKKMLTMLNDHNKQQQYVAFFADIK